MDFTLYKIKLLLLLLLIVTQLLWSQPSLFLPQTKKRDMEVAYCSSRRILVYLRIISKTHDTGLLIFVMIHGWMFAFRYVRYVFVVYVTCMSIYLSGEICCVISYMFGTMVYGM